jgi:FlaA1/EpsC-like NDP-sugar epimerase
MIQLSGLSIKNIYNPNGDIKIVITGLRPGEKLYEELLISENPVKTKHPKIFRSNEPFIKFEELDLELNKLSMLIAKNDVKNIFHELKNIITEYSPNGEIVDHTFINK